MVKRIVLLLVICSFLYPSFMKAQESYTLSIIPVSVTEKFRLGNYRKKFPDTLQRRNELLAVLNYLHDKAFLEARFDSLALNERALDAFLFVGRQYRIGEIRYGTGLAPLLQQTGLRLGKYKGMLFSRKKIRDVLDIPVRELENDGYPFARCALDSVIINDGNVTASLIIDPGNRIRIDSLVKKGNLRISKNYMFRYLGIKPGNYYNESRMMRISRRLQDLPFASVIKPYETGFWNDRAKVILYLNKRKASNFSGIIGVLPNARVPGKVLINGEVRLRLVNAFAQGELIDLNWRSFDKGSQDLKMQLNFPYLFTTPFGLDYQFILYKKDTSYLTLSNKVGLQFLFSAYNYLQAYADIFSSDIIRASGLENVTVLPDYADIRRNMYGLLLQLENLDYRLNPRKGYRITGDIAAGNKNIKKNDKVNPALYDSLQLRSGQLRAQSKLEYFQPVYRKHIILFGFEGGYIWNEKLFENELFRLGGLNSLRGFDEESLRAGLFGTLLLEYRFLFERNSFLSLFWNGAYLERNTVSTWATDRLYGLGAGISFDTRIGIFSLYYALGSQNGQPLSFRQSKVHFGMRTFF